LIVIKIIAINYAKKHKGKMKETHLHGIFIPKEHAKSGTEFREFRRTGRNLRDFCRAYCFSDQKFILDKNERQKHESTTTHEFEPCAHFGNDDEYPDNHR
jgi:hypothetical protein